MVSSDITDMQVAFVEAMTAGKCPTEAARLAGYAHPSQAGYKLIRSPEVMDAIQDARRRLIGGRMASLAVQTLETIMRDASAPVGARVTAARTILDAAGDLKRPMAHERPDDQPTDLAQLTPAQIRAALHDVQARLKATASGEAEADQASSAVH